MHYQTSIFLCLLQFTLLTSVIFAANEEFFVPQWQKGDRWLVKTQRKSSGKTTNKNHMRPSLWIFKVVNTRDELIRGKDYRFFHILVRSWKTPPSEEAALLFLGRLSASGKRVRSLHLIRAAFRKGKEDPIERFYNKMSPKPFPVINDVSPIPSSFPLFSDGRLVGRVSGKKNIMTLGAAFPVTKKIGNLPFARDVMQKVTFPLPKNLLKVDMLVGKVNKEKACLVSITRPDDNQQVSQVWQKGYPWFIYSETALGRSWLAKVRRKKRAHSRR